MKKIIAIGAALGAIATIPVAQSSGGATAAAPGCSTRPANAVTFGLLGRYSTPPVVGSTETRAENVAYEGRTMWVMNIGSIDVVDLRDPANPTKVATLTLPGEPTSVAVSDGLVAVSVPAANKTDAGKVVLFRGTTKVAEITVGSLPDMVTFTKDGRLLLVANEGEPNSYGQPDSVDPEGSVSIITTAPLRTRGALSGNATAPVQTVSFAAFNAGGPRAAELPADVRIYGPGASVAQDLEPEYITVDDNGRTAWVSLQENNAIARIDLARRTVRDIVALGYSDHSVDGFGIDASDQNGGVVNIATAPVKGIYSPDGIANYEANDRTYVVTANEGDARDWVGINASGAEYARARSVADLVAFPTANDNNQLGRLNVTTAFPATKNAAGKLTSLYSAGSRSFSIRTASGALVWDSGDTIECIVNELLPANFNASNSNNTKKNRSDDKGPEPEIVVVGEIDDRDYAFVGLERIGGVMVFDITNPTAPVFQQYLTSRDFSVAAGPDSGPEGMAFVKGSKSPTGKPMLLVGNEVSGTVQVFGLQP